MRAFASALVFLACSSQGLRWHAALRKKQEASSSQQLRSTETTSLHRHLKDFASLLLASNNAKKRWQLDATSIASAAAAPVALVAWVGGLLAVPQAAFSTVPLGVRAQSAREQVSKRICKRLVMATQEEEWEGALSEVESERLYNLGSKEGELSQFALWLQKGKLNLFPEYQREYVWKPAKASRLIATVLCNRFIPPVVLHERKKGCYDVVDGKQRLTSILGFYLNGVKENSPIRDPTVKEKLEKQLPNLECLVKLDESYERLNGLNYNALTEDRKCAYESYSITYVVIPFGTPKTDVFEVYDDINSGGENLTPQQVRRAVYYGPYIEMLDTVAETCTEFHEIRDAAAVRKGRYESCPTHSDRELILRAFAFRERGDRYKMPLKKFLNEELEGTEDFDARDEKDQKHILAYLKAQKSEFEAVMKVARNVFGGDAFRKWTFRSLTQEWMWSRQISLPLWDASYVVLTELLKEFRPSHIVAAKEHIVNELRQSYKEGFFAQDSSVISDRMFLARKDELKRLYRQGIANSQAAVREKAIQKSAEAELLVDPEIVVEKIKNEKNERIEKKEPCPV